MCSKYLGGLHLKSKEYFARFGQKLKKSFVFCRRTVS